jgi:hypothetical protein
MNPIKIIIDKIDQNDFDYFKKSVLIYITVIIMSLIIIQGLFFWNKSNTENTIKILKEKKNNILQLIEKKNYAQEKKESIDELLKNKEPFRLKDYLFSLFQKNNFTKYVVSQNESITEQKVKRDYIELTMNVELTNLSTSEIIQILALIENDIRIYIKNIIIKNLNNHKLHLIISIATLQFIIT